MEQAEKLAGVTSVEDVVFPIEFVTLTTRAMRRADGSAIVVGVEFIDEEVLLEATENLPGGVPNVGTVARPDRIETSKRLVRLLPLLNAACFLRREDGSEVRPAFYYGDDPKTGALPAKFLSYPDRLRLVLTILRVCGYTGGPAAKLDFRDEGRKGSAEGAGTVDAGEGDGRAPGDAPVREAGGEVPPA